MKKFSFLLGVAVGCYFRDNITEALKKAKTKVDEAIDEDAKDPNMDNPDKMGTDKVAYQGTHTNTGLSGQAKDKPLASERPIPFTDTP